MEKTMKFALKHIVEIGWIVLTVVFLTLIGRETAYQKTVERNCGDNTQVINDLPTHHFFGEKMPHISRGELTFYPYYLDGVYSIDIFNGADLIKTLSFPVEKTVEIGEGFRLRSFIWEGDIKVCTVPFYLQ